MEKGLLLPFIISAIRLFKPFKGQNKGDAIEAEL